MPVIVLGCVALAAMGLVIYLERNSRIANREVLSQLSAHTETSVNLLRAFATDVVEAIHLHTKESAAHVESAQSRVHALLKEVSEASNAQVKAVTRDAFDHLQSKSLAETAQVEHARAMNSVAVSNLQDALAKVANAKPVPKRKLTSVTGETYTEDELEAL